MPRSHSFILRQAVWAALVGGLAGCHSAPPSSPYPTGYSLSPYRQPAETAAVSPADREAIYHIVLQFYRPTHEQVRWIDQEALPTAPGDSVRAIDPALIARLVQSLGSSRYCIQGGVPACPLHPTGGSLRVSEIYGLNHGQVRLAVHFTGYAGPYASGSAYAGTEVFLVERENDQWRIAAHAPAAT